MNPTTPTPTIGLLHPGRMGAAIAAHLQTSGTPVLWCPKDRSHATAERAEDAGLEATETLDELLQRSDIVLCICPPAAAESVAEQVAAHQFQGLYVEANAISPHRAERIAERLTTSGARVVDACIFGPPPTSEPTIRFYLSGQSDDVETTLLPFIRAGINAIPLTGAVGKASALKLILSAYQKTSRALAAVAYALADHHDLYDQTLAEAEHFSRSAITDPATLPSVAARAWRWEPEMAEVAATLQAAGLPADFAQAAASAFARWHDDKDDFDITLKTLLSRLHT